MPAKKIVSPQVLEEKKIDDIPPAKVPLEEYMTNIGVLRIDYRGVPTLDVGFTKIGADSPISVKWQRPNPFHHYDQYMIDINVEKEFRGLSIKELPSGRRVWDTKGYIRPTVIPFDTLLTTDTHPYCTSNGLSFGEYFSTHKRRLSQKYKEDNGPMKVPYINTYAHDSENYIGRFSNCVKTTSEKNILVKNIPILSEYGESNHKFISYSKIRDLYLPENQAIITLVDNKVPVVSQERIKELLSYTQDEYTGGYVVCKPSVKEFEDNSEMLEKVKEHCKSLPGLEVTYLRKVNVLYSGGDYRLNPYKYNNDWVQANLGRSGAYDLNCVLYSGEAWRMHFTVNGKNLMGNNLVYFATPEQFYDAFKDGRPDLVKDFKAWSDLIFVCSHWCERNSYASTFHGVELQSPMKKMLSLFMWIASEFTSQCIQKGKGNPFNFSTYNMFTRKHEFDQSEKRGKNLETIEGYVNKYVNIKPAKVSRKKVVVEEVKMA